MSVDNVSPGPVSRPASLSTSSVSSAAPVEFVPAVAAWERAQDQVNGCVGWSAAPPPDC